MVLKILVTGEVLANTFTGVEHYTLELVTALARRPDVEISILCQKAEHAARFGASVGRRVHPPLAGLGIAGYWLAPPRCLKDFDVVHCPTARTPFLFAPAGPKLVLTVHDLVPLVMPECHTLPYRAYYRHVLPRLAKGFDALIASSEATRQDLASQGIRPAHAVTVVHLGARWPSLSAAELESKDDYFLAVGTLEPRKNLERVIEGFLMAKQKRHFSPDRLVVVGKAGWSNGRLQSLLNSHANAVDLRGYVSDDALKLLYRKAKALVYPSLYEGFGLPVLEAMSQGCPVITSRASSLPEVAGDAALYVDPYDASDIAAAIGKMMDVGGLREELARKGLAQAALFTWDRCAAETAAVYRQVMAPQKASL